MIGIIGHWLTPTFEYRERIIDFRQLSGEHSGENLAEAVYSTLQELDLTSKLFAITGDNASNNEKMITCLHHMLRDSNAAAPFQGQDSFVRCISYARIF